MLRQWILNLVFAVYFIPGSKKYADILAKPLALDPFRRFRDAILGAKIVLPPTPASGSVSYVSRLSTYIAHALSLPDDTSNTDICSSHCSLCAGTFPYL